MNGDRPKIEIFEPFGTAYEVMKRILFQPFDFSKWLAIGFAAFLSGHWGPNLSSNYSNGDWSFLSKKSGNWSLSESMPWLIPVLIGIGVVILILFVVFMWLGARGRFIFVDCVVKNRGAIALPWREYRREGNSFFFFSLAATFLAILLIAGLILVVVLPLGLFTHGKGTSGFNAWTVSAIVVVGLLWLGVAVFFALVTQFMVPVMYRRRCLALEAFVGVWKLILARPGSFVLFALFSVVLFMAFLIVGTIVTCLTCCLAGLPYVSSVVFLPAFVWLLAFKLMFLRQFGPEYDVWWIPEPVPPLPLSDEPPPPSNEPPAPPDASPPSAEI